jgi:hypothetical protein
MAGFSGATGVPLKQMQDAIAQSTAFAEYKSLSFDSHSSQISAISGYVKNGVTVLLITLNNTLAAGWNNITTGIKTNDTPLAQISGSFAISSGGDGAKVFRGNLGADGSLAVYCSAAPSANILLSVVYPHK